MAKTFGIPRRSQSLELQSQTYLQNLDLLLEGDPLRMQQGTLPNEDRTELLRAMYSFFVGRCKEVTGSLHRIYSARILKNSLALIIIIYSFL